MSDKKYPVSEIFTSPQGEGVWTGTLMTFIRLAGCCVGKPFPKERYTELPHCKFECKGGDPDIGHGPTCAYAKSVNAHLPIYTEQCTTYDGRHFECDTDYRTKSLMTSEEIVTQVPEGVKYICLTGGEPLMHNLCPLLHALTKTGRKIHIETSGTRMPVIEEGFELWFPPSRVSNRYDPLVWITVSPKAGVLMQMIERADEIKLLVDNAFKVDKLPFYNVFPWSKEENVFIQPINHENSINQANMKLVLQLQLQYPHWKISTQMHKLWQVR
jgi:organic radical activating enzyme